jgi:hypothetical protein
MNRFSPTISAPTAVFTRAERSFLRKRRSEPSLDPGMRIKR